MGAPQPKRTDKSYSTYNRKINKEDFRECLKYILNLPEYNNNSILCNFMNECNFYEGCIKVNKTESRHHGICEKQRLIDFGCDLYKYFLVFSHDGYILNGSKWRDYELQVVYPAIRHIIAMYYDEKMVNDSRPSLNIQSENSDVFRKLKSLSNVNKPYKYNAIDSETLIRKDFDFRSLLKPEKDGGVFINEDHYKEMFYKRALFVLRQKFKIKEQDDYNFNWNYYFIKSINLPKIKSFQGHLNYDIDQHIYGAKESLVKKQDDIAIFSLRAYINALQKGLDQYDYAESLEAIKDIYSLHDKNKISPSLEEYFYLFELFCLIKLGSQEKDKQRITYLRDILIQKQLVETRNIYSLQLILNDIKDRKSLKQLFGLKAARYVLELEKMGVENVLDIKQPVYWVNSLYYKDAEVDSAVVPFKKHQKRNRIV